MVMKTKILPFALLILCVVSCRRPTFPKPGEPTMTECSHCSKPSLNLPWRVMKGMRIAEAQPCTYTMCFSLKNSSLKKS